MNTQTKIAKFVICGLLFMLSSYFVYFAVLNIFHQVINHLQRVIDIIPIILSAILSLTLFIGNIFVVMYPVNTIKLKKNLIIFGSLIGGLALSVLVSSFVLLFTRFGGNIEGVITDVYPVDSIALGFVSLGVAAMFLVTVIRNRSNAEKIILSEKPTKAKLVGLLIFAAFSMYFTGMLMIGITVTGINSWNRDGLGVFFVLLLFVMPAISLLLYSLRMFFSEQQKPKVSFVLAVTYTGLSVLVIIATFIYTLVNPIFLASEMHYMFPVGFAIKMPFGLYILYVACLATSITALTKTILAIKRK